MEKFGRKPLHTYGIGAIGVCAGVMALLLGIFLEDPGSDLNFIPKYNTDAVSICAIVFVLVGDNCVFDDNLNIHKTFVAIFQCGPGPIPWGMAAELFDDTNRYKNFAMFQELLSFFYKTK